MKKLTALFLCLILILSLSVPSFAVESQVNLPAPEIKGFSMDADGKLQAEILHSLESAEELRNIVYDIALEKHGSVEALLASPERYLTYKTGLYLEISPDGEVWETVRNLSDNNFTLSAEDLLPFSADSTVFIRILLASENFRNADTEKVYVYRESEAVSLMTDKNTVIPVGIPLKFGDGLAEDFPLFIPEKKGYIFDGWSADTDKRIGKIPAGTKEITLTAHFIPMVYEINYVLTTDINYPFGRADNSKNPVFYTVGEGAKLCDIKSPIGGYTFMGWYTDSAFSGEKVSEIEKNETGDRLFFAKWVSDKDLEEAERLKNEQYIRDNKFGDPDGDGAVTASDARYVLRAAVGLEEADEEKLKRVDFFGTGKISSENARTTLRIAVGLDNLYDILLKNGILG